MPSGFENPIHLLIIVVVVLRCSGPNASRKRDTRWGAACVSSRTESLAAS